MGASVSWLRMAWRRYRHETARVLRWEARVAAEADPDRASRMTDHMVGVVYAAQCAAERGLCKEILMKRPPRIVRGMDAAASAVRLGPWLLVASVEVFEGKVVEQQAPTLLVVPLARVRRASGSRQTPLDPAAD